MLSKRQNFPFSKEMQVRVKHVEMQRKIQLVIQKVPMSLKEGHGLICTYDGTLTFSNEVS
jgi:hypothetical protein